MEWFNQVDVSYRTELRDLNELNFTRFDAKLEQRVTQLDAKWEQLWVQLDAKLEQRTAELRRELRQGLADLRSELIKWMFLFWVGNVATTIGVAVAVIGLAQR